MEIHLAGALPCGCIRHFDTRESARKGAAYRSRRAQKRRRRGRWDVQPCPYTEGAFRVVFAYVKRDGGSRDYPLAG